MKYWVYLNGEVPGCYPAEELVLLPGFSAATLVCPAEGDIEDKNWRRAGEFVDIIKATQSPREQKTPLAAMSADALRAANADDFLDSAGARLFRHVSDLVGELESFRETKSLVAALQKQMIDAKEELRHSETEKESARENLKKESARLQALQDSMGQGQEERRRLEAEIEARQKSIEDLRLSAARASSDADAAKRRLDDTLKHLAIRNKLVDKLSQDLSDKESSLAKAVDVIRRLEGELERLLIRGGGKGREDVVAPVKSVPKPPIMESIRSVEPPERQSFFKKIIPKP
ncbi:MAG TPA: hypothetical protein VNK24_00015 [Elusimicrobiota bacterium]|nr:hypothetical protein [Elusimicrobiota bacterium]